MTWYYKDKIFTSEMIEDYVGFVYQITDRTNDKKYIGKKGLISKRRLPPLKGKKRRDTVCIALSVEDGDGLRVGGVAVLASALAGSALRMLDLQGQRCRPSAARWSSTSNNTTTSPSAASGTAVATCQGGVKGVW